MNAALEEKPVIRLDIGCGPNKKGPEWTGVDLLDFKGVDVVFDLRKGPWPWEDNSVECARASHFLEHLTNFDGKWERVTFFNELYRVMKPGGQCELILPHWASNRYYGDPTHKEPFSEMGFYYLDPAWRKVNAPHTDIEHSPNGYSCHWSCTWGYSMHPELTVRNAEYQQYAMKFYKEGVQDIIANMTAVKAAQ